MTAYLKWSYGEPAYVFDSVVWNYGGPSLFIPATGVAHYTISCAAGSFSFVGNDAMLAWSGNPFVDYGFETIIQRRRRA